MEAKYIVISNGESYGIALIVEHRKEAHIIESHESLTADKQKMQELVDNCNELSLEPIHLKDVVADFTKESQALV